MEGGKKGDSSSSWVPEGEFVDLDPWEPGGQAEGSANGTTPPGGASTTTPVIKEQVLKMSSLVDQMDESELAPPSRDFETRWTSG